MLAAALTIARRDEVEANQLVHDHSMDGNRPGDIDDIVQENARLLREMQEQEAAGTNNFFFLEQFAVDFICFSGAVLMPKKYIFYAPIKTKA